MPQGLPAPGAFNENASHRLSRGGEKVRAAFPHLAIAAAQTKPGLVNQSGRLQSQTCGFVGHFNGGQFAQFFIHQWEQPIGSLSLAFIDRIQKSCHFAHLDCGDPVATNASASCNKVCAMMRSFQFGPWYFSSLSWTKLRAIARVALAFSSCPCACCAMARRQYATAARVGSPPRLMTICNGSTAAAKWLWRYSQRPLTN